MIAWFEKHYVFSWIIAIVLGAVIFYISSLTFTGISSGGSSINAILYHIVVFFLFGFFLMISIVRGKRKELIFLAFVLALIYGVSDEIHQIFVPGRMSSVVDVFYDFVGILFAFMIYSVYLLNKKN